MKIYIEKIRSLNELTVTPQDVDLYKGERYILNDGTVTGRLFKGFLDGVHFYNDPSLKSIFTDKGVELNYKHNLTGRYIFGCYEYNDTDCISEIKVTEFRDFLKYAGLKEKKFCKSFGINCLCDLTNDQLDEILNG